MTSSRGTPAEVNQDMILGEMRGQLREVVHSLNNLSGKVDGLSREVIGLGSLAGDIGDIKARLAVLEVGRNRQEGATSALAVVLKSPTLGWLVGAAITAWAILTGKVQVP